MIKPRINVISLATKDLEKAVAFYRDGLGWPTDGIVGQDIDENGAVAFFTLDNGLILAVWPKESMHKDAKLLEDIDAQTTEMTLGYNVNSKQDVDEVLATAKAAGAKIVDPAQDRPWGGYSGYFADVDGHLWDVVWNPELTVSD